MPLHDYASAWETTPMASPNSSDFPPLPDGNYPLILERAEIGESKTSGAPMVKLGFKVAGGESRGRWVWKNSALSTDPKRIEFLKRDLAYIGVDVRGPIESLEEQLAGCIGAQLTADLRTKRGNDGVDRQNVYLNAPDGFTVPDADDSIPF